MSSLVAELESSGKIPDARAYLEEFLRAELTFHHQIVYDVKNKKERHLKDPAGNINLSFLGELKPDHIAIQIARGDLNPKTLEKYIFNINAINLKDSDQTVKGTKSNQEVLERL